MDIRQYVAVLWRRKWVIVLTVAVTVAVATVGTVIAAPKYVATTTVRVLTAAGGSLDWVQYDTWYADRLMNTYAELVTSDPVLEELVERLSLDEPPEIEVEIVPNTELIQISVGDRDPAMAAQAADTLAEIIILRSKELHTGQGRSAQDILVDQLAQIEDELSLARKDYESVVAESPEDSQGIAAASRSVDLKQQTYAALLEQYEQVRLREAIWADKVSVVDPADVPAAASSPRPELNIALGFVVGLAGGVGLAFLFENLDTTLYATRQIEEVAELSVLGKVPDVRRQRRIALFDGNSPQLEALRRLRTKIFSIDHDASLRTLLVTSAGSGEGKSTIVANLAFAIAQSGRRVVVVDGDLRRPALHEMFGLSNELGLSNVLKQEVSLEEAVQSSRMPGVQVLTSGPLPHNPAEWLNSPQMAALIKRLGHQCDMVLVDAPALLAVTDAAVLAPTVDGVLLVVERAQTRREAVRAARQQLVDVKARWVGLVVNRAEHGRSAYL
jgi:non-specific protein-tyrosine kinase